jgi:hypothetical protein
MKDNDWEMPGCFDMAWKILICCIILLAAMAAISPFFPQDFLTNLINKIPHK